MDRQTVKQIGGGGGGGASCVFYDRQTNICHKGHTASRLNVQVAKIQGTIGKFLHFLQPLFFFKLTDARTHTYAQIMVSIAKFLPAMPGTDIHITPHCWRCENI